jgi:cell division protein FtsQ
MPAALMAQHHYSFPVVTGIDSRDPLSERRRRMAVYQRLIRELDSGPTKFSAQISEIDLRDPSDARVLMPEPGGDVLAHFGSDNFLARFQTYEQHIAEWRQQMPRLAAVDLRYEQQVVLSPAKDAPHVAEAPKPEVSAQAAPPQPVATPDSPTAATTASTNIVVTKTENKSAKPSAGKHSEIAKTTSVSSTNNQPQKKNASAEKSSKPATKATKTNSKTASKNKKSSSKQKPAVKKTAAKPATHTAPATGQ